MKNVLNKKIPNGGGVIFLLLIVMMLSGCPEQAADPSALKSSVSAPDISGSGNAPVRVADITVNPAQLTIVKGDTVRLTAVIKPSNAANQTVTWKSSAETVAAVNAGGLVTAKDTGSATITVTTQDGGKTAVCEVKVVNAAVSITLTEKEVSVARLTDEKGEPQAKASAAISRPDFYFALQGKGISVTREALDNALWYAKIPYSGTAIMIPVAKLSGRAEFNVPLEALVRLKPEITVTIPVSGGTDITVKAAFASSDAGIEVAGKREFPEKKYINLADNTFSDMGGSGLTELVLHEADDFNYHFNGLNYKNYGEWKTARAAGSDDKEAQALFRLWQPESDPDAPTVRHSASWDIRGVETKNSKLLIKTLQRDANGIYLAKDKNKKYEGFTDLYSGPNAGDSPQGSHKMINGSILTKSEHNKRYGYFEAKVRIHNPQAGNWSAFWVYGDHYEFDIMEYGKKTEPYFDQTTHWHNGWTTKFRDSVHNWSKPSVGGHGSNGKDNFFTLGLYWDETRFVYFVNGKKTHEVVRENVADLCTAVYKRYEDGNTGGNPANPSTLTVNASTGGQIISDDKMWAFFSNEVLYSGWMGNLANENVLPSWMEVEYYAYYRKK